MSSLRPLFIVYPLHARNDRPAARIGHLWPPLAPPPFRQASRYQWKGSFTYSVACRPNCGRACSRKLISPAAPGSHDATRMMKTEDDYPSADLISAAPPAPSASASSSVEPHDSYLTDDLLLPGSGHSAHPAPGTAAAAVTGSQYPPSGSPTKPQHHQHQANKRTVCDHCRRRRMCDFTLLPCLPPCCHTALLRLFLSRQRAARAFTSCHVPSIVSATIVMGTVVTSCAQRAKYRHLQAI